ncbi:hypothetical protein LY78DRAFT_610293 [Colletotrichum sublineola]|uniref:MEI5 protein n=1 Tax=Colletotrichum sublineola TaxID=1173701 RepID=A0A066X6U5_COLSU|nr:hypothetical protein LY78DRAFT_610293 [Colletotrichum sublineola]KDN61710.1 hypothetical protein CSUB01_04411 [Colletotrichum sublineola]
MASQTESSQLVENCVKLFQTLSADPSFDKLRTLVGENESLRAKSTSLQIAYDVNLQTLTGLQKDVAAERGRTAARTAELEASKNTVAGLEEKITQTEATLKKKVSELDANAEGMSKLQGLLKKKEVETQKLEKDLKSAESDIAKVKKSEKEAQDKLKAMKAELAEREARLSKLDSFSVKLEPVPSDAIRDQLGAIFKNAFSLMRNYLGTHLEDNVLSDSSSWNEVRNHPSVRQGIPVFPTNSPASKKMRVAASLAILASALMEHVFQPTYLLGDNELARLLDEISTTDFERETHLRSVLLPLCPSKHKAHASERASKASNTLFTYVGPLLPEDKRDGFELALHKICQDASRCWTYVQRLADRVKPMMKLAHVLETDSWKRVEFPGMDGQPSKAQGSPSPGGKKNGVQPKTTEASGSSSAVAEDIAAIVWPAFVLFVENEDQETLHEGLVLEESQVEEAEKEEESLRSKSGARRTARQNSRRQSTQNGSNAAAGKPFLSAGAGRPSGGD